MRYYVENDGQFTVEINFWKNTCDVWYETVKLNEVDKKLTNSVKKNSGYRHSIFGIVSV